MPLLAIGGASAAFTPVTIQQVATNLTAATVNDVGHYVAMEAPDRLAKTLLPFYREVDRRG
jgi:pimeloyl-ACP methyl ester carboxylesterase